MGTKYVVVFLLQIFLFCASVLSYADRQDQNYQDYQNSQEQDLKQEQKLFIDHSNELDFGFITSVVPNKNLAAKVIFEREDFGFQIKTGPKLQDCVERTNEALVLIDNIVENYKVRDVSSSVNYLKNLFKICRFSLEKLSVSQFYEIAYSGPLSLIKRIRTESEIFKLWEKSGYYAEVSKAKAQIKHYSKYRNVDLEAEIFYTFAKKLGYKSEYINNFINTYTMKGRISEQREKDKYKPHVHPDVDLRDSNLNPQRLQTIRWCTAFAYADLLTYKLKKRISASDIGLSFYNPSISHGLKMVGWEEQKSFGSIALGTAIENIKKIGGACLEDNMPSEFHPTNNSPIDSGSPYKSIWLYKHFELLNDMYKWGRLLTSAQGRMALSALFPKLSINQIQKALIGSTIPTFVNRLRMAACHPRISLKNINVKSEVILPFAGSVNRVFSILDKQLTRGNVVAISFNNELLKNIDTRHVAYYVGKGIEYHTTTVVGRRFGGPRGECEYLLSTSKGSGCYGEDSRLECDYNGYVWLPKSVLVKGLYSIDYIE